MWWYIINIIDSLIASDSPIHSRQSLLVIQQSDAINSSSWSNDTDQVAILHNMNKIYMLIEIILLSSLMKIYEPQINWLVPSGLASLRDHRPSRLHTNTHTFCDPTLACIWMKFYTLNLHRLWGSEHEWNVSAFVMMLTAIIMRLVIMSTTIHHTLAAADTIRRVGDMG